MNRDHSTIAIFDTHASAEAAIRRLAESGFPIERLSIIGKGYETEKQVVGFFNLDDRVKLWGKNGALWGGLWGLLTAGVFMTFPVIGPVVVLGHLAAMVFGALEGAVVIGGLGALAGALASIGVPNDSVLRYEQDLRAATFLVVVHGSEAEAQRAQELLAASEASRVEVYTANAARVPLARHVGEANPASNSVSSPVIGLGA
jgi:hypothetical protein